MKHIKIFEDFSIDKVETSTKNLYESDPNYENVLWTDMSFECQKAIYKTIEKFYKNYTLDKEFRNGKTPFILAKIEK